MKARRTASQERAGLYVRVSLDRSAHGLQEEILSPETQEDRTRQYCGAQGWAVMCVERDIDESAYRQHYSHRPALMRLLAAIDRGDLTKLVVFKFSRLSRRLKEFIEICDRVEAAGAGVVSVTEQVDTGTPAGRLIRNILASFAQFQSEEISEQIYETWLTKARRGERPPGSIPYGCTNRKGILEPDPRTHRHLLAIFEAFRRTGSVRAVWDDLTARHVPPPKAGEWSLNTIRGILTNPIYVSQIHWAGEVFQAKWPPIVPSGLWQEVQDRLRARRTEAPTRRDVRMLTGLLRCGACGRAMWTRYVKRGREGGSYLRRVYWCCSHQNLRRGCDVPVVDAEEAEAAVWEAVVAVGRAAGLDALIAGLASDRSEAAGSDRRRLMTAEQERVKRDAARLFDLLGDGSITREQFRLQNLHYMKRLDALAIELSLTEQPSAPPEPDRLRAAAAAAPEAATEAERRQVLVALDARIAAGTGKAVLTLLGLEIDLAARRISETWHFGRQYQCLDFQGSLLTDKQVAFIRRTYRLGDKRQIAARLGRSYATLVTAARRLRQEGILPAARSRSQASSP